MGIFDRAKVIVNEDEKISRDINELSIERQKIEQLIAKIEAHYEAETIREEIAYLEEVEWHFYDEGLQIKKCELLEQRITKLESKEPTLGRDVKGQQKDIRKLIHEQVDNKQKIEAYKRKLRGTEDGTKLMEDISHLEERNKVINKEIEQDRVREKDLKVLMEREKYGVKNTYAMLIIELAHMPENHLRCRELAMRYDIENRFTKLALKAIQYYVEGEKIGAVEHAVKYFEGDTRGEELVHTPLLDELYTRYLLLKKAFGKAKAFAERLIYYAPEKIEFHEMLREIHLELGEEKHAEIEEKIITLLG